MARKPLVDPISGFLLSFATGGAVMVLLDLPALVARTLLACLFVAAGVSWVRHLLRRNAGGQRRRSVSNVAGIR